MCTNWTRAFDFLIAHFDVSEILKYPVRTFDFIPQDARPDVRNVYFVALTLIAEIPPAPQTLTIQSDDCHFSPDCRCDLLQRLHALRLSLPALILIYGAQLGTQSRIAKIRSNCKLFFDGRLDLLYA